VRYDSEASKSVGLFEDLRREARKPRCDACVVCDLCTSGDKVV